MCLVWRFVWISDCLFVFYFLSSQAKYTSSYTCIQPQNEWQQNTIDSYFQNKIVLLFRHSYIVYLSALEVCCSCPLYILSACECRPLACSLDSWHIQQLLSQTLVCFKNDGKCTSSVIELSSYTSSDVELSTVNCVEYVVVHWLGCSVSLSLLGIFLCHSSWHGKHCTCLQLNVSHPVTIFHMHSPRLFFLQMLAQNDRLSLHQPANQPKQNNALCVYWGCSLWLMLMVVYAWCLFGVRSVSLSRFMHLLCCCCTFSCADLSFVLSVVTNKPLMATDENSRLAARWIACSMLDEVRYWCQPDLYWLRPNLWSEFNVCYYVYDLVGGSLFLWWNEDFYSGLTGTHCHTQVPSRSV